MCEKDKGFLIRLIIIALTTAVGLLGSLNAPAQGADTYLGGTRALGRVTEVYVKGSDNVFLALKQAPQHLQKSAERWVDVEFSDLHANDIASARTVLNRSQAGVNVGDVVEIQFAHRENPRFFPLNETTRVTAFVKTRNETPLRDFEHALPARGSQDPMPAFLQMQARAHTTHPSVPPGSAAAGDGR